MTARKHPRQGRVESGSKREAPGRKKWLPVVLIISPWPIMLLMYYLGPIAFRPLTIKTWVYLTAMGAVLTLGYQVGWGTLKARADVPFQPLIAPSGFKALVLVSLVASITLLTDSLQSGFSFDLLINDPAQGRVLQAAHVTTLFTTLSFPFAVFSFSAFLFALTRHTRGAKDRWNLLGFLAVVPLLLSNVLQAGRQTFLIIGLLLVSWFVLSYGDRSLRELTTMVLKRVWLILPILVIVLIYFFFIAARRHDVEALTLDTWFRMGSLSPRSVDLAPRAANEELLIGGYSGVYYYTHQIQALDTIVNSDIPAEGFGRGVFSWILLQFSRTGIDLTYDDIAVQTAMFLHGENMSGWRTGFATLISDFGVPGSLIFVFLASMVLGRFIRTAYTEKTDVHLLAAIWMMSAALFMIQFFPSDGMFTTNLLLIVFLRFRRSHSRSQRVGARLVQSQSAARVVAPDQ